ncbi:histidine phosphatase family protein [Ureibacillus sp. MALMAid1270]|uniref:histidine phosphatase family protein n=1 Tax=Ureibacillus sp. MALMAid1270 TaxID=3411629 RepID=UPI003BA64820
MKIYIIRHCSAEGQPPEARLTEEGEKQAVELTNFFANVQIDRIISSPFKRAVDTIHPLATKLGIEIEQDSRLAERVLSTENMQDWLEKLKSTFDNLDVKFEGGESSREAMTRIVELVEEVQTSEIQNTVLVSHGNLLSLLLKYFNNDFGFESWKSLSNPDVYLLTIESGQVTTARLWN